MGKRRTKRTRVRRATAAERRRAQRTVSGAFKKIGVETRGRKRETAKRIRVEMAKVIRREFLSKAGEPLTAREAESLSRRFSLAGVARRQAARTRTYYVDARGRFRDNRPATRGRFISSTSARRRDSLAAYWATVKLIARAQGVTVAEARRAYTITGGEPWRELSPRRTP